MAYDPPYFKKKLNPYVVEGPNGTFRGFDFSGFMDNVRKGEVEPDDQEKKVARDVQALNRIARGFSEQQEGLPTSSELGFITLRTIVENEYHPSAVLHSIKQYVRHDAPMDVEALSDVLQTYDFSFEETTQMHEFLTAGLLRSREKVKPKSLTTDHEKTYAAACDLVARLLR